MAMFGTHLGAAVVGGTILANSGYAMQVWGRAEILPVIALVVIGGLLPDIDAKKSHSVRLVFSVLGLLAMVGVSAGYRDSLPMGLNLLVSVSVYALVRHGVFHVFNALSVHRGNAHSLIAMFFACVTTTAIAYQVTEASIVSWVYGLALALGIFIHLLLDELYAVDIAGGRLKKSFGTALKGIDTNNPLPGLAMLACGLIMVPAMPPLRDLGLILARFASVTG